MKRSVTSTLFLGILVLLLAWSPAYAAQVATVVAARGEVQALDAKGKGRALTVKAPIFEEDTIKTGEHSRIQIMFTDNTLINLGNATTMKIAEYRWQPEQNDGALKTQVKEGTFRVMGGALTKTAPQNFKTETPTATIGIRGSMYAGVVTPDFLSVVFQGGKGIEITNAFGTVEISKPGFGTKVATAKPPLPPMKFTAKEMGEMNKALSGNGAEGKEEKKEDKKEKGEEKGKGPEKAPAPKEEQSTAPAPTDQPASTAPAPADSTTLSSWETTTIDPVMETTPPVLDPVTFTPPLPLIPPVPHEIKYDVVVDDSQDGQTDTTSETAATTTANSTTLAGNYRFFLRDVDLALPDPGDFYSTFVFYNAGTVAVTLFDNGELSGTLSDGTTFGPYLISGYNPNATSYSGFSTFTDTVAYADSTVGSLNLTVKTVGDSSGQFFYNTFYYTIDSVAPAPDYLLAQLLYAGKPSASIPTAGIDMFTGHLIYNNTSAAYPDADMEKTSIEVNYYNRRLIGRSSDMNTALAKQDGAVFFGTVNSNGTADIIILGGGGDSGAGTSPTATYGTGTATLYGDYHQGLGFTASGADYYVNNNTQRFTWEATGAALRAATETISSYPTSPLPYAGFVVGVADNTATGAASRIFMNSAASDFTMLVNPTTGAISGFLIADELFGGITLDEITIGHSTDLTKSAYVLNDQMVAILSDADPNYALSGYGNFLYTAGPNAPEITNASTEYMTWGYWEMAYTDPYDGSKDHLFSSQSFFVAGQQTPTGYLNSILGTASFTGTYDGKAFGVQLDATGQNATQLTNGATHLVVNFPANLAANSVTGTISFDQASLAINSAANSLGNDGFYAYVSTVSGTAPSSSAVNGAFYGLNAEAVGGNFQALMGTGVRYLGVFGGNR